MAEHLPLLVFPRARMIAPPKGNGFPPSKPHFPGRARQVERLSQQLDELQQDFTKYKASVSGVVAGLEPETVLVIEIAGSVDDFRQAVEATDGLDWLGEWDVEEIEPDDDFYEAPKIGVDFFKNKIDGITTRKQSKEIQEILKGHGFIDDDGKIIAEEVPGLSLPEHIAHICEDIIRVVNSAKKDKRLKGRLFLSLGNEQGLKELLTLWRRWETGQGLPQGKTKWRDVFDQTIRIRRWGIQETLYETGMIDLWRDLLDPLNPDQEIHCQIELFYANDKKRKRNEETLSALLTEIGGGTLGPTPFIDMPNIAFHAVKAKLPADRVRHLLETLESPAGEVDIHAFKFPWIMYFRPTGQSLVALDDGEGEAVDLPHSQPEDPPVVAILDGVPNLQHEALVDRLLFDDPDNLSAEYQPGERRHGTSMASLVVHGELKNGQDESLTRKVYHAAVMQPNPAMRRDEYFPDEVFFEDRIERAVRRMFEGEGDIPAQAPDVKIINLSIGDPERPFIHTPSSLSDLAEK